MRPVDFFPFFEDLKKYKLKFLKQDLIAAISVALMALPQSMAYAFLAGLPTSMGIWSVIFGVIFTASFGQSRFLVSGTTNMVAILMQSGISEILYTYYPGIHGQARDVLASNIAIEIILIIGIFQCIAGLLRLGRLTEFTSRSVVMGYISGGAATIVVTQLFPFFGIKEMDQYQPLYQQAWFFIEKIHNLYVPTILLSISSLILLIIFHRISVKIPGAAVVFLLAGSITFFFHLAPEASKSIFEISPGHRIGRIVLLQDFSFLSFDVPRFSIPFFHFRIFTKIIPLAFAIALLSVIEATTIGRNYTSSKDSTYDSNQEIYGLGVSNCFSSFLYAMPSSGSFSRSALNIGSGACTRFSAIMSGLLAFLFIGLFGFLVNKIPISTLSALMIFVAYNMINFKDFFICLRATRGDAFVLLSTFLSSMIFTLDITLYIGVVLSVVIYLKRAAIPYLIDYAFNNFGKLRPLEAKEERPDPRICILQPEGELFFGAADLLQAKLRDISEDDSIKILILQLLNTRYIDASICLMLRELLNYLKATGKKLLISGISTEVWKTLEDSQFINEIGKENLFPANEQLPSEPTRNAYKLAKDYI
ncbi:MAG: SulP family inorganic anion transporter [Chlamydiales bacterium]